VTAPAADLRIVQHSSEHGRWWAVFRPPDPRLGLHVRVYQGYRMTLTRYARGLEVASTDVPLIFNFGPALRVIDPRRPEGEAGRIGSFVAGLFDSFVYTESSGPMYGLQVNLSPLGAYRILGLPMGELTNRVVEVEDLLGAEGRRLLERLAMAPSWERRFALLDAFFLSRLAASDAPSATVDGAWQRLAATHGLLGIGSLAAELGVSQRHLIAQFRAQVGLPPKTLARILRFKRALDLLDGQPVRRWAELAYDCGYYDQAHFNRDFREFTGTTPSDFLTRRLPEGGGVAGD